MIINPIKTRIVQPNDNLLEIITEAVPSIPPQSILVVTSKIVALSQGRVVEKTDENTKHDLIVKESDKAVETKWATLTIHDGLVMPNAGIDESNADGKLILSPKDSFGVASDLRTTLLEHNKIEKLGIIISDSRVSPLRVGTVGIALGYAGFKGFRNYIGVKDLYGRPEHMTKLNIADNLASAAILEMGEAAEQMPLALIEDPPVEWADTIDPKELRIDPDEDLYGPLFRSM